MALWSMRLPDVGEGVAEAELVEWHVGLGDLVREDQIVAAVMTDKATVEIPADREGKVAWLAGTVGQAIAVGSELLRIETDDDVAGTDPSPDRSEPAAPPPASPAASTAPPVSARLRATDTRPSERPIAPPSVRGRARNAGVALRDIAGSGPAGRITHEDLDAYLAGARTGQKKPSADGVRDIPVIGLRRKIAERLTNAKRRIPHITIIEEVDVTALEDLREKLNAERRQDTPKLTLLPFLMAAIVKAVREQPMLNAHYDDEAEIIRQHEAVHIGIATQTSAGLMVPVIRHAESLTLWQAARQLSDVAEAARNGTASREQLSGSTISITSLGALGAIATTPIINHPEVAIVGVNRMAIRPAWNGSDFVPRKMMNLSSSFDHRIVDGWDAAVFVKRLKDLLETPALIFLEPAP